MRKALLVAILTLLGLGFSQTSFAWGKFGHLTVCDLAYRNLTPDTRIALQELMHSSDGGITVKGKGKMDDRHYTSFNLGCLEEDELPRKHASDHFLNVDRSTAEISSELCPGDNECILSAIQRDFSILQDSDNSDEDRVFALMALGHWVADIHQPLHVSFADDRGGNSIDVDMKARCASSGNRKPKNLHAVWDNCLLEAGIFERVRQRKDFKSSWGPRTITYRAVDTLQANTSLAEEKTFVSGEPWRWADESYQITIRPDVLYCVQDGADCAYTDTSTIFDGTNRRNQPIFSKYLNTFSPLAQERVRRAGFRLADLINKALDSNYAGPLANSTQKP